MAEPSATPDTIEATIVELLRARGPGKTICPSEAARELAGGGEFRPLMDPVRNQARRMAGRGELEITQHGEVVDGADARGPIRLRFAR